jgi:hypothetical protein
MRRNLFVIVSLAVVLCAASAFAAGETATGALTISGTLAGSITLTIGGGNAGATTGGTIALGTVTKYGSYTPPTGFTRSNTNTSPYRVGGGTFTVTVNQANVDTPTNGYALAASIGSASGTGVTWTLGVSSTDTPVSSSVNLSDGASHDIFTSSTNKGSYGTASTETLNIDITDAAAPATVNPLTRTITFTATAN